MLVIGAGAVGTRLIRQLVSDPEVEAVLVTDRTPGRATRVAASVGAGVEPVTGSVDMAQVAVVALAVAAGDHRDLGVRAIEAGADVVSVADSIGDVRGLTDLDAEAVVRKRSVVVGAGYGPGLTCLLARHAAGWFDRVEEIHVAKSGTGGPDCARQHHRALGGNAIDWRDGVLVDRNGRSGRELVWFPEPVGALDCYRGALADSLLLVPEFPGVRRVTSRISATRRDRLTALLPMMRRPHPEGGPGGVKVEVRGVRGSSREAAVLGAVDNPATAAATVAAVAVSRVLSGEWDLPGSHGLAAVDDATPWLAELARRGVKAAVFEGAGHF